MFLNRLLLRIPPRLREIIRRNPPLRHLAHVAAGAASPNRWTQWTIVREGRLAGARLLLQPRTEWQFALGQWELPVQDVLDRCLVEGSVFWDVGAHIGVIALYGAKMVGDDGQVVAFEPDPNNTRRLKANVEANDVHNVVVVESAVGSSLGTAFLERGETSAMSYLTTRGSPVPITTLDAARALFRVPSVIKVDVEGHEVEVLRGGCRLLAGARPVVVVEVHDLSKRGTVASHLTTARYQVEAISDQHLLGTPLEKR